MLRVRLCKHSNGGYEILSLKLSYDSIPGYYIPSYLFSVNTEIRNCFWFPSYPTFRCLYELDQHLERFLKSATMAKIKLPFDGECIRSILIQTVSASKCRNGSLRYWLSAGPGDFQLSPSGCSQSSLYAIVIQDTSPPDYKGIKAVTSSIPIKPPQFAVMKSVNYLPNALSKMEAEENGAYVAIWLDFDGFIAEGPNMNVAFVTKEKELLMPRFDKILSGCTAKRALVLAEDLVREGKIKGIRTDDVTVEEGKNANEMMLLGSGVLVRPVLQWDEQVIGDGKTFILSSTYIYIYSHIYVHLLVVSVLVAELN